MKRMNMLVKIILLLGISSVIGSCGSRTRESAGENPAQEKRAEVPVFDADSAYAYVRQQVDFGCRVPNTPAHEAAASFLSEELARHGAGVYVQSARITAYDGTVLNAKNIIGSFSPEKTKRVLLFAHWDTRPYADNDADESNHRKPVLGANDGASGVGVLLEIARQIGARAPEAGIDIIFFDAEDYGQPYFFPGSDSGDSWALGTQYWVSHPHKPGYRARYGILLDMVGGKEAVFAREGYSRHYAKAVLDKVWTAAQQSGYGRYFIDTPGGYITDDHVYVNQMGIPSIDIIQYDSRSGTGFCPQWHTLDDTMEHIDKQTLKAVGQTVLEVIYNE